jgi:hypothetical protein
VVELKNQKAAGEQELAALGAAARHLAFADAREDSGVAAHAQRDAIPNRECIAPTLPLIDGAERIGLL